MKKKLQVFISSTYEDMKIERQKAVEAILSAGHIPAGMELFASENEKQWKVIQRWIRESDVFLILLGGRYGSIEPKSNKSYIHNEYEYAVSKNKIIMSIIISDEYLEKKIENGEYDARHPVETEDERYKELKGHLLNTMSSTYKDIGQISFEISRMFSNNTKQFNRCSGWVSGKDFRKSEKSLIAQYSGVNAVSVGLNRDEQFYSIRERAKKEINIIGAGMNKLARISLKSLESQLEKVPVHLYMLNPKYLENNSEYAALLEDFFDIKRFHRFVRLSYDTLKEFCEDHNNSPDCKNRISLSAYNAIPSMSMVLIDPNTTNAEMIVEFFTYKCGEKRPLLYVKNKNQSQMYESLYKQAKELFKASVEVVK